MIAAGLLLALVGSAAINLGYVLQHDGAAELPPISARTLHRYFLHRRWVTGFFVGIGGWVFYVVALRLAPLSLVQAASAVGIAILAVGATRLSERLGVGAALVGLVLLGLSLGSQTSTGSGSVAGVTVWIFASLVAAALAARLLPRGAGLGTAAGVLYAAGDVGTKAAVEGRLWFIPVLLACHGLAFLALQSAFRDGTKLATAGPAVLWTNALPILAGMALFGEAWGGPLRVTAFALVLTAAVALSRVEPGPPRRQTSPRPRREVPPPAPRAYAAREGEPT